MKNLAKSASVILAVHLLSKGLGFVREIALAYRFGTSYIVDVYTTCISLPTIIFAIYSYGFSESYIPIYTRVKREEQNAFFSNVLTILFLLSILMATLCTALSGELALLLAPGFSGDAHTLLIQFVRLISLLLPILTTFSMLSAHVQAHEDFIFVNFCGFIIVNVIEIISIFLATESFPELLPIGYVSANLAAAVALWIYAVQKKELAYRPRFQPRNRFFLSLCSLAVPVGVSRLVNELNGLTDRVFASILGEGVISSLSYANRVQLLFYSLTTAIFLSVCYPRVNQRFAEGDREGGLYYIRRAFLLAAYISVPVAGGLFLFANPVVAFLFQRGNFTTDSTTMTAGCLAFYALGLPFYALREIGSRALSASLEQKKIMKNTVIAVGANILLDFLLLRPMGYQGLALATSLAGMLSAALMLLDARKLGLRVLERSQLPDLLKISGCAALALALASFCYHLVLPVNIPFALILAAVLGAASYGITTSILKVDILIWLYARFPKKLQVIPWLNRAKP